MTQWNRVFPVGLMLEGQPCLMAGGGKVATRKVHLLLDGGAMVTVVAPEISRDLAVLAEAGRIKWIERGFEPADIEGGRLVYAASDDSTVNRRILDCCRAKGILCCAVDSGWRQGDFVTPAIIRAEDLTISVSTAGRSCRRARLVKDSLSRHISAISSAGLIVLGTSHEELALAGREPLHLTGDRLKAAGGMLSQVYGLHEYLLLNTCNRIELHAIGSVDDDSIALLKRVLGFDRLSAGQYYLRQGIDAFEHTCALCAGLLSQLPGENHIVAQVKQALDTAVTEKWAAGMLQEWMSAGLHVSKEVRQAVKPFLHGREIEDLAVEYLEAHARSRTALRMLVLGSGKTGAGFLSKIMARFPSLEIEWCYHEKCPDVPAGSGERLRLHRLESLNELLVEADLVVSAMSTDEAIITSAHAPLLSHGRPVLMLDLAMPRNIEPTLAEDVPSISLIDLDSLKCWHRREQTDLPHLRRLCHDLAVDHKDYYEKLITSFQGRNEEF